MVLIMIHQSCPHGQCLQGIVGSRTEAPRFSWTGKRLRTRTTSRITQHVIHQATTFFDVCSRIVGVAFSCLLNVPTLNKQRNMLPLVFCWFDRSAQCLLLAHSGLRGRIANILLDDQDISVAGDHSFAWGKCARLLPAHRPDSRRPFRWPQFGILPRTRSFRLLPSRPR